MTSDEITAVLERVRSWPPERREDLARIALRAREAGCGRRSLSDAQVEEVRRIRRRGPCRQDRLRRRNGPALEAMRAMRLRYCNEARARISQIHSYIAKRNPRAATAVVERMRAAATLLQEFPYIGHEGGTRRPVNGSSEGCPTSSSTSSTHRNQTDSWSWVSSTERRTVDDFPFQQGTGRDRPEGSRPWRPRPGATSSACFPAPNWVPPVAGPDGRPALDVLVIGGGMCGQTAAFALVREGVRNVRIIDRAPRGREGPWGTYARMETLRSPKHLTGPDIGFPALTFRAWYEAQHGADGWQRLYKVATSDWLAYLLWVRDTVPIADRERRRGDAASIWIGASFASSSLARAASETVYARKVVLAGGRDGAGAPYEPPFPSLARAHRRLRAPASSIPATDIDFARFRGGKVGVLGASASAFDNAAAALEAGARAGTPVLAATAPAADQQVEVDRVSGLLPRLRRARRRAGAGTSTAISSRRACRRPTSWCCAATATPASPSTSPSPGSMSSPAADGVDVVTRQGALSLRRRRSWRPASPSIWRDGRSLRASTTGSRSGRIASRRTRPRAIPSPRASPISVRASSSSSARRARRRASATSTASMPARR